MIAVVGPHSDPGAFWVCVLAPVAAALVYVVAVLVSIIRTKPWTWDRDLNADVKSIAAHQARTQTLRGHR